MISFGNAAPSHSGLTPKNVCEEGYCSARLSDMKIWDIIALRTDDVTKT